MASRNANNNNNIRDSYLPTEMLVSLKWYMWLKTELIANAGMNAIRNAVWDSFYVCDCASGNLVSVYNSMRAIRFQRQSILSRWDETKRVKYGGDGDGSDGDCGINSPCERGSVCVCSTYLMRVSFVYGIILRSVMIWLIRFFIFIIIETRNAYFIFVYCDYQRINRSRINVPHIQHYSIHIHMLLSRLSDSMSRSTLLRK